MEAAIACSIRVAVGAVFALMGGVTFASAQCLAPPSYSPDFTSNQTCLTLNGANSSNLSGSPSFATAQSSTSTVLRLTANQGGWATSAWYQTPQVVANGFSTTFAFQLGNSSSLDAYGNPINADGIAFVIQNSALTARGPGGCGIGFGDSASGCAPATGGIPNSVAIEFNTYNNGTPVDPNSSDDVTIQNCGGITANSVDLSCSVKYNDLTGKINLTDGNVHVATVTYSTQATCGTQTCSALDVVLDGVDLFPGGVPFDITTIGLTGSSAWVGFTAGTGGDNDDQDIVSWTFTPAGQSQVGTVSGQTPANFNINGGFTGDNSTTGYNFSAQQTTSTQTLQMVVTAIPITQPACNTLVQANTSFKTAQCFVYQNGGGPGQDTAVLFEVTCPPAGSCGSNATPFNAELGTNFAFKCAPVENLPLQCATPPAFSFGLPNLTSVDGLPAVGLLKGEGPDALHPCTPNSNGTTPLFQSNQIDTFILGDTSGGAKGGSGGTTSCWVLTYQTQAETPGITITQPVNGTNYSQGESDATTLASYSCSAVNAGSGSAVGPYLTVATCSATDSPGTAVASGTQFDTGTLGPHTFTVQAQDSATNTNSQSVTYSVVAPAVISGASSAVFTLGSPGSVMIGATGYPVPAFTEAGLMPAGVTFVDNKNGTATLGGTATVSGIFPIVITAQNSAGAPAMLPFTLTVVTTVPAAGTKCNGVYTGTFKGNLTVANGQTCIFEAGGVTGNVTQTGGKLVLANAAVGGNVQVVGGTFSIGPAATIKGNLLILAMPNSAVQSQVCGATVGGGLEVLGNSTPVEIGSGSPACPGNTISGDLLVSLNAAATGIFNNTIGGSLLDLANAKPTQVFSNKVKGILSCTLDSAITGGGNTATKKQGQCASF